MDGNERQQEQGATNITWTVGQKTTHAEPAPPPLTRNLDSGPSLPISDEGSPVKLWWWIAVVVAVALAIVFVLWRGV